MASVSEENSSSSEEVSAAAEQMLAQVQEMIASLQNLRDLSAQLNAAANRVMIDNTVKYLESPRKIRKFA